MLPLRKPSKQKRDSRWRSPAHRAFVRDRFACAYCGSTTNTVFAHYRLGSGAGMGQKPDDWRGTPLCDGPTANADGMLGCHNRQHIIGEETFWADYAEVHGQTVMQLIDSLCAASPKAADIRRVRANV